MKVLSVNAAVLGGGAEKAALALHESYLACGIDSILAVANQNADADGVMEIPRDAYRSAWARVLLSAAWRAQGGYAARPRAFATLSKVLRVLAEPGRYLRVARGYEDFEFPWTKHLVELPPFMPDIVHFHNLHGGYFDIRALPTISAQVPTVITMHDGWILTGHCAQPFECLRWKEGCDSCQDLRRYVPIRADKSAQNLEVKRRALLSSRVALAAPSQWMLSMANEAGLMEGREVRVIYNGIDTEGDFVPGSREEARLRLGLPMGKRIALIVAKEAFSNPLKGFNTFIKALAEMPASIVEGLLVVVLGEEMGEKDEVLQMQPLARVKGLPFLEDPAMIADYYRAADVFVNPSLAESFSLVTVEAMACGAPVIASDAGGIPEIVLHGKTGICFKTGSSAALASGLVKLLSDDELRDEYASKGIIRARSNFSLRRQAGQYLEYYSELRESFDTTGAFCKGQ